MNPLKGHLLVATPQLLDPNFAQTVLLMFEHSDAGAAGFVLNRLTEATVANISEQVFQEENDWDKAIQLGGPVPGPLIALHTVATHSDQEILPGLYSTAEPAKLQMLIHQKVEPSLLLANYAGWGPGQLEAEIADDSWQSLPASLEHVFWTSEESLWEAVRKEISTAQLSDLFGLREVPDDPSMN